MKCRKCGQEVTGSVPGIGPVCANPECDAADGVGGTVEDARILLLASAAFSHEGFIADHQKSLEKIYDQLDELVMETLERLYAIERRVIEEIGVIIDHPLHVYQPYDWCDSWKIVGVAEDRFAVEFSNNDHMFDCPQTWTAVIVMPSYPPEKFYREFEEELRSVYKQQKSIQGKISNLDRYQEYLKLKKEFENGEEETKDSAV